MTGNIIENQGSWGVVTSDFPDDENPPSTAHCQGGIANDPLPGVCLFRARGNRVYGNVLRHDGFFGNLTNSDLATETLASYAPRNCFYSNTDRGGPLTSEPADIESASVDGQPCGRPGTGVDAMLAAELVCATSAADCPLPSILASYPQQTRTVTLPLPRLPSMPKPCAGVPKNSFCP